MFKKFSSLPDPSERLEIFNLLKFNLALCRRLGEFLTLIVLIAGFGGFAGRPAASGPPLAYAALLIGLALFCAALPRWLFLAAESTLAADFGLDPRPGRQRLAAWAALESRWFLAAWLLSVPLFQLLAVLDLWAWTLTALASGAGLLLLDALKPHWLRPEKLRPPLEGEVDPNLGLRFDKWAGQMGFKPWPLRVATTFSPFLEPPRLSGFGPTQTLVISEKALGAFTPRALNLLAVSAMVEGLVKAPLKFLFLRGCALAVAVPLAAVFISTLGTRLWLYPLVHNPALIILVWLAGWLGLALADFSTRLVRRDLSTQLAAAAALILKDDEAADAARTTLSVKNLEEETPPAWRNWFSRHHSRPIFLKRFQYYRRLNANAIASQPSKNS
ncbi:MAG: hypothetical protein LBC90_03645 [Candidatus Adiutrix sp.]|jgi:hypothetical protein|nr:hypothetical protein [Candidatus Adiutrix sp.]